ncbi:MAG TPA: nuclear transport factor 2 family protein [Thermoleophilaceae bacterium]|jgi:steroid delta-isomerase-like uncharacterized protein
MAETTTAAGALTNEWVEEFGERYFAAWDSHDPDRLLELMTEDVVYEDSAWPMPMNGHAEVREFLEFVYRAFPDIRFEHEVPLIAADEPRAAFPCVGWATNSGPIEPPGIPATGEKLDWKGIDIIDFRDGMVSRLRILYNPAPGWLQLGLLQGVELDGGETARRTLGETE